MSKTQPPMDIDLPTNRGVDMHALLWSVEHIAVFYTRSDRQARRIVKSPGFPPPTPADKHRWSADRVRRHAEGEDIAETQAIAAKSALVEGVLTHTVKPGRMVRNKKATS